MLILAIDSSGMTASAALVTEDKVLSEMSTNNKKTHSQTLLPMIETVLAGADLDFDAADAIAVAEGPGSFTGLRIGAALAKGLGLSLDKPLIGVPTMDAMAYGLGPCDALICPMIDARHETVYTGLYTWGSDGFKAVTETTVLSVRELAEHIREVREQGEVPSDTLLIIGDGADAYAHRLRACLADISAETVVVKAPVHLKAQRAAAIGALALRLASEGKTVSADDFKPRYYRITQAERERRRKEQDR